MAPIAPRTRPSVTSKQVSRKKTQTRIPSPESSDEDPITDLHDIASRVGREVDVFAETLDQFKESLQNSQSQRGAALRLCTTYRDFAADEAGKLRKQHQVQHMQEMRDSFAHRAQNSLVNGQDRSSSSSFKFDSGLKSLRQWQQEADTWDLMCAVLQSRYPSQEEVVSRRARFDQIGPPHRYISSEQLWQRFILSDNVAQERHLIRSAIMMCDTIKSHTTRRSLMLARCAARSCFWW
ncbi:Hypothetical protein D9617_43g040390 [Elsinoe fawcettii]|nr:Hypothetical protein D9617_43g040390 [Elsinoe fawcettii]